MSALVAAYPTAPMTTPVARPRMVPVAVAPAAASGVPATRLRITDRGRKVLGGLIALIVAGLLAVAALTAPSAAVAGNDAGADLPTITVLAGDTMWGIAELIAPNADPRTVIHDLKRLNRLDSAALTPGQVLVIPAQYAQ